MHAISSSDLTTRAASTMPEPSTRVASGSAAVTALYSAIGVNQAASSIPRRLSASPRRSRVAIMTAWGTSKSSTGWVSASHENSQALVSSDRRTTSTGS